MTETSKQCPQCKAVKSLDDYGLNATLADGRAFYCKDCCRANAKAHYRRKRAAIGRTVRDRTPAPEGSKWCPDCGDYQPLSAFPRNAASRDGWQSYCKVHHLERGKRTYFQRKYGIDARQVEQMFAAQGGACAICERALRNKGHVDHDHATGDVRGLLCFNCNGGLGQFKDDPEILARAIDYLERSSPLIDPAGLSRGARDGSRLSPAERLRLVLGPRLAG